MKLVSQEIAAVETGKSLATIARLRSSKKVETWRQGGRVLVDLDEVRRVLAPKKQGKKKRKRKRK